MVGLVSSAPPNPKGSVFHGRCSPGKQPFKPLDEPSRVVSCRRNNIAFVAIKWVSAKARGAEHPAPFYTSAKLRSERREKSGERKKSSSTGLFVVSP